MKIFVFYLFFFFKNANTRKKNFCAYVVTINAFNHDKRLQIYSFCVKKKKKTNKKKTTF